MSDAERVVCSYPADLSDWGREVVEGGPFRAYLRKAHDGVAEGDLWAEFAGVGCCGATAEVPLRIERVDGGDRVGEDTAFSFVERDACDVRGGWRVQSAGDPSE